MVERPNSRRNDNISIDDPPMSRLFIIYSKGTLTESDFRNSFEQFGDVEDVWIVKDRDSREEKGVAYVKFSKTSNAARALEELNGRGLGNCERPVKIFVASSRSNGSKKQIGDEHDKYLRLFLVTPKNITEEELRDEFNKYGNVDSVLVIRDRNTGQPKGFSYVKYYSFLHAALAFENCPPKYKAVFADPKSSRNSFEQISGKHEQTSYTKFGRPQNEVASFLKMQNVTNQTSCLKVICSNAVNQDQLWKLFDIVPALDYCRFVKDSGQRNYEACVVYTNPEAAIYAREKLHGFEYPPGERLIVKLSGLDSRSESSILENSCKKDSICNVELPPPAPLVPNATVARRCFIVVAVNLPQLILRNIFCTFGNLIDVYLLPNKNCGYAKYATEESADRAIQTLNGAEVCGVKIKVLEAEEIRAEGRKRMRRDD